MHRCYPLKCNFMVDSRHFVIRFTYRESKIKEIKHNCLINVQFILSSHGDKTWNFICIHRGFECHRLSWKVVERFENGGEKCLSRFKDFVIKLNSNICRKLIQYLLKLPNTLLMRFNVLTSSKKRTIKHMRAYLKNKLLS